MRWFFPHFFCGYLPGHCEIMVCNSCRLQLASNANHALQIMQTMSCRWCRLLSSSVLPYMVRQSYLTWFVSLTLCGSESLLFVTDCFINSRLFFYLDVINSTQYFSNCFKPVTSIGKCPAPCNIFISFDVWILSKNNRLNEISVQ